MEQTNRNKKEGAGGTKRFATFFIDETLLGVDIRMVREINEEPAVTRVPLATKYVKGIMNLRGQIITIIDLRRKMGFASSPQTEPCNGVVIVNWHNEQIGLMFDRIGDVIESPEIDIERPPSNISGVNGELFQGVLRTDKNKIVAVLDIDSVLADETSS
ncbi:MAG: chemotaxis protein CheW [Desulfobulbaceae bacterium]|nr:chemotaxis protein CheW [Desulfobulbaceae bacterium]